MSKDFVKLETYKGVPIYYHKPTGRLKFEFEGDKEVQYLFEAERIIDEPVWEEYNADGYYLDHSLEYHIGLAKATRRNIKTGRPDWKYKGKYDLKYKPASSWDDNTKVYPITDETAAIYDAWVEQRSIAQVEQRKADNIAQSLTRISPKEDTAGGHAK